MDCCRKCSFAGVQGTLVDLEPACVGDRRAEGCMIRATIEEENGNTVNFVITPSTFIVDWEPLNVGQKYLFWYRTDAPAPLICPPQYTAAVAAKAQNDRMIDVSHYNAMLVNEEQTLQLNIDGSVKLRTVNNQYFQSSPAEHDLAVIYETSTRSIPAQTTPKQVIVLCDMEALMRG